MIGITIPVMVMSIVNGFHDNIKSKILDKDFHLQVYHRDDLFENYQKTIKDIKSIRGVKHVFPFHDGRAIIKYETEKTGIIVRGYTQNMFDNDESFKKNFKIVKGKVDFKHKTNRIVLGVRLALKLGLKIGDITELYVDRRESSTGFDFGIKRFKVTAIFRSGYGEFDKNIVFISLSDAQKLYNYEVDYFGIKSYKIWGLGVKLNTPNDIQRVGREIKQRFTNLRLRNFEQLNGNLLYAFRWEKRLMMVVLIIMVIATVLTVMLILTVVVMDKKKEIGIMKSFGVSHSTIKKIFVAEGFIISLAGTFCGLLLGVILTINIKEIAVFIEWVVNSFITIVQGTWISDLLGYKEKIPVWQIVSESSSYSRNFPYRIEFSDLFLLSVVTLFWSLIGALLPAKKATQISVLEAIRNE